MVENKLRRGMHSGGVTRSGGHARGMHSGGVTRSGGHASRVDLLGSRVDILGSLEYAHILQLTYDQSCELIV